MSNIVDFPTKSVQSWTGVEKIIRDILNQSKASHALSNIVIERMKVAYKEHEFDYSLSFNFPSDAAEIFIEKKNYFLKYLQERMNKLLISRIMIEVNPARAQGNR